MVVGHNVEIPIVDNNCIYSVFVECTQCNTEHTLAEAYFSNATTSCTIYLMQEAMQILVANKQWRYVIWAVV
jgi:hypothetical protein